MVALRSSRATLLSVRLWLTPMKNAPMKNALAGCVIRWLNAPDNAPFPTPSLAPVFNRTGCARLDLIVDRGSDRE